MFGNVTEIHEEDDSTQQAYKAYQVFAQTGYKKGDHVCSNYGRACNRYWIVNYAFAIRGNEYDSFPVFVNVEGKDVQVVLLYGDGDYSDLVELVKTYHKELGL